MLAARPLTALDLGWNLRTGQWIVTHRALPATDPFLFTSEMPVPDLAPEQAQPSGTPRNFILRFHWGGQVMMYGLWSGFGDAGLVVFRTVWTLVFLLGIWLACAALGVPGTWRVLVLALALVLCWYSLHAKPNVISLAMTSLSVWMWLMVWRTGHLRWGWGAAVLLVLWSHLHGGFVFGMALALAWIVGLLVEQVVGSPPAAGPADAPGPSGSAGPSPLWPSSDRRDRLGRASGAGRGLGSIRLWKVAVLGVFVLGSPVVLNPTGIDVFAGTFGHLLSSSDTSILPAEHLPPDYLATPTALIIPLAGILALALGWRRAPVPMLLMVVGATGAAMMTARASFFFAALGLPVAVALLREVGIRAVSRGRAGRGSTPDSTLSPDDNGSPATPPTTDANLRPSGWLAWAAVAGIVLVSAYPVLKVRAEVTAPRESIWGRTLPVQAGRFVADNPPPGRPYNHYNQGGALVWFAPSTKWFIDGRNLNERLTWNWKYALGAYANGNPQPVIRLFNYYRIQWAILPLDSDAPHFMLAVKMIRSGRWQPAGPASKFLLLVRRTPESAPYLDQHAMPVPEYQRLMASVASTAMSFSDRTRWPHLVFADYLFALGAFDGLPDGEVRRRLPVDDVRQWLDSVPPDAPGIAEAQRALDNLDANLLAMARTLGSWPGGEAYAVYAAELEARMAGEGGLHQTPPDDDGSAGGNESGE